MPSLSVQCLAALLIKLSPSPLWQVGNVSVSHSYWLRPEDMVEERPAYVVDPSNPGTDVVAAAAAALAATSAAFLPINREYAGLCMQVGGWGLLQGCQAHLSTNSNA
jgi:hypothetical protein